MTTTTHDIEIILDEDKPVEQQRVLKATVDCSWVYERNPGDKEVAHYHGEDDGAHIEDWSIVGEVEVNGEFYPVCPPDLYTLIEKEVENLEPE